MDSYRDKISAGYAAVVTFYVVLILGMGMWLFGCAGLARHVEQTAEVSLLPNTVEGCNRDIAAAESEIRAIQARREQFLLLCSQYPVLNKVRDAVLREMDGNTAFLKERIEQVTAIRGTIIVMHGPESP